VSGALLSKLLGYVTELLDTVNDVLERAARGQVVGA
jgi:hypothetical protein